MSQILTFILYFALFQSCTKVVSFKCNINRICEMFDPSCDLMFVGRGAEIDLLYKCWHVIVMFYFIGMLLIISPRKHDLSSFVDIKLGLYM